MLKGGRETGTDAERFAIYLGVLNVCLSLRIMSGDTNLPIYIPIHLFSLYVYRMPTTCLLEPLVMKGMERSASQGLQEHLFDGASGGF